MKPPACGQSTPSGTGSDVTLVDRRQLGVSAAAEQREHALAGADDLAGALEARDVDGRTRRRRVVTGDLHQVGVG